MSTLGERILQLRTILGLSQKDLAYRLGWSDSDRSKLSTIEKDKSKPSYEFVAQIIEVFPNVNAVWLLTGVGEMFLDASLPTTPIVAASRRKASTMGDLEKTIEELNQRVAELLSDKEHLKKVNEALLVYLPQTNL